MLTSSRFTYQRPSDEAGRGRRRRRLSRAMRVPRVLRRLRPVLLQVSLILQLSLPVQLLVLGGCATRVHSVPPPAPVAAPVRKPLPPMPPPPPVTRRPVEAPPAPPAVPAAQAITLGHSVQGRPIVLHEFGSAGPCLFIFGGIHGSEPTSVDVAEGILGLLRTYPGLYSRCRVAVLPRANPDGLMRGRRANANRVDLNRNFPARNWKRREGHGTRPGSEPETQALLAAMERLRPAAVVSIHSIQNQPPCNNYDGPGGQMAETLARYNGYRVIASIGYPTPGSFGSWCGGDLGIPTITLELPRRQAGGEAWRDNQEAMLALLRSFADVGHPVTAGG